MQKNKCQHSVGKAVLVLTQAYPDTTNLYAAGFVHTRNLAYLSQGFQIDVISFACKQTYEFEGITVYPADDFKSLMVSNNYNAIICHAPNLRNHIKLLLPFLTGFSPSLRLPKIFFIFHGHEILHTSKYYPPAYKFAKESYVWRLVTSIYDRIKCHILRWVIKKYGGKRINLIFVSEYLRELYEKNIGMSLQEIKDFSRVINNPVNPVFIKNSYDWNSPKKFDFITIRPFDKSVYAMELILKIAQQNPGRSFHIYGQGKFFTHTSIPKNVKVFPKFITPVEMPTLLNKYKVALMPSWHDSQGVMMCEMATFGIPVVMSDIPASREMMVKARNVKFINNCDQKFALEPFIKAIEPFKEIIPKMRFSMENTALKELEWVLWKS